MKNLKEILESQNFLVNRKLNNRQKLHNYEYFPETKKELKTIIVDLLKNGQTDLNCIDVSQITNLEDLFSSINDQGTPVKEIDISEWDVSNVTNMWSMFYDCKEFNSDLSNWDVSKVENITLMFRGCKKFNSNLSRWNVSNIKDMDGTFNCCNTLIKNKLIPKWYKYVVYNE